MTDESNDAGISKEESEVIKAAVAILKRELQKDLPKVEGDTRNVTIYKFGTFKIQLRKAREAISPKTKEKVQVPAKTVVKFKASSTWLKDING